MRGMPAMAARHASHDSESCEPRWRVNMRITQLLKQTSNFTCAESNANERKQ